MSEYNITMMQHLLNSPCGKCSTIGEEKNNGEYSYDNVKIKHFSSKLGSERLVAYINESPVAMMQVMKGKGYPPTVANVFCEEAHRREGLATMLYSKARTLFGSKLKISSDLSKDGLAWANEISRRTGEKSFSLGS